MQQLEFRTCDRSSANMGALGMGRVPSHSSLSLYPVRADRGVDVHTQLQARRLLKRPFPRGTVPSAVG